jgi:hypothetical protein
MRRGEKEMQNSQINLRQRSVLSKHTNQTGNNISVAIRSSPVEWGVSTFFTVI